MTCELRHHAKAMNESARVVRGISRESTNLSESSVLVNSDAVAPKHKAVTERTRLLDYCPPLKVQNQAMLSTVIITVVAHAVTL